MPRAEMTTNRAWWWFPWAIAGAFVLVFCINGALAYYAIHSSTGLVSEHPFELGNGYNEILAEGAAEDALGWHGAVRFVATGAARGTIEIVMKDAAGQPLNDLGVAAQLVRPIEDLPAIPVAFARGEPGRYVASVDLPRHGQWQVRVRSTRGRDAFVFAERIFVP